ncbi:MAG: hypothetical protein M1480_19870 [Bacteroidetes bacterium]|nr:hypothetical protein [Bacteroidota bacterium]
MSKTTLHSHWHMVFHSLKYALRETSISSSPFGIPIQQKRKPAENSMNFANFPIPSQTI